MTTDDAVQHSEYGGAGAALEFALWSLDDQIRTVERTDGKSERAMTLGVAIVALFSGALTLQFDGSDRLVTSIAVGAAVIVACCFIAAIWLFFRSYAAVNWYLGPAGDRLLAVSGAEGDPRTRQWLAEQILASVEQNAGRLRWKTDQATWLFRLVLFEAVGAGVGLTTTALLATVP